MSVFSKTFGYSEVCGLSHEFLRRGCSFTPKEVSWAGDLIVIKEEVLKHSLVDDMRGGESDVSFTHTTPTENCSDIVVELPNGYKVEETSIRTGGENSFEFTIPKATNPDDEHNWDLDVYESLNDCGVLMDGGDAYQNIHPQSRIVSLCGTVDKRGWNADAYFLDNRLSYSDDPDKGCLIAMNVGLNPNWDIRYLLPTYDTKQGLMVADNITESFMTALTEQGLTQEDIIMFGMI